MRRAKDKAKLVATLSKKCIAAIKKTAHNDKKKPYTEVCEGIGRSVSLALLGDLGTITSDTRVHKRRLSPGDVAQLLGIEEIHPVKYDGKTSIDGIECMAGERPYVYAWAKVDCLEIKVEDAMMSLKFRTYSSGYGTPNAEGKCVSEEERSASFLSSLIERTAEAAGLFHAPRAYAAAPGGFTLSF